jgi:hypothetical protein
MRLQPKIDFCIEMDTADPDDLANLRRAAEQFIVTNDSLLAAMCTKLMELKNLATVDTTAPLRILCIDGGGIKGLIPAIIIQNIEARCGE